jgi:hypothetical protein
MVKDIAAYATSLYNERCSKDCEHCSNHGCSNENLKLSCSTDYPDDQNCETNGREVSFEYSVVRETRTKTSHDKTLTQNINSVDVQESICTY